MKTLDDLHALFLLHPWDKSMSVIAWASECMGLGILSEKEWADACDLLKKNKWIWSR